MSRAIRSVEAITEKTVLDRSGTTIAPTPDLTIVTTARVMDAATTDRTADPLTPAESTGGNRRLGYAQ